MKKIMKFLSQEVILCVALALAILSSFFVPIDKSYLDYIDWHTLILLFCLMVVMAGFQKLNLFLYIGNKLLSFVKNSRQLALVLVFLPFFFSMLITNDVALITFVPFAIIVLSMAKQEDLLVYIVVLQTIAANLGSMLTPMGNPQNLYLYGKSGITLLSFLGITFPYVIFACVCILALLLFIKKDKIAALDTTASHAEIQNKKQLLLYCVLFILSLLSVLKIIPQTYLFIIVVFSVFIMDASILEKVDYSLLFTFIGFFIFIGNIGRLEQFRIFLQSIIDGKEAIVAIISSQIISNVPAALLLSGFTENWTSLIIGTNLGGLGTLIASMASLISYKMVAREYPHKKASYFRLFTGLNILLLILLIIFYYILK